VNRIETGQDAGDDRVPRLVVRDDLPLLVAHHALLLEPGDDPIDRVVEIFHLDGGLVLARGEERRLVDEVGQIGAGEAGRALRDDLDVDAVADLDGLDVDAQDVFAPADVGLVHEDLAIEASGAE
jgi:hypothetical protein